MDINFVVNIYQPNVTGKIPFTPLCNLFKKLNFASGNNIGRPTWTPAYNDDGNCVAYGSVCPFVNYTWTQVDNGYIDVFGFFG